MARDGSGILRGVCPEHGESEAIIVWDIPVFRRRLKLYFPSSIKPRAAKHLAFRS